MSKPKGKVLVPEEEAKSHQWHLGRRAKLLIVAVIVAALVISSLSLIPTPQGSIIGQLFNAKPATPTSNGLIGSAQAINSSVWRQVAANAWAYYQPGVGVDAGTGLPYAGGNDFKAFTGWDLGVYIQSIINAQKLGLVSIDGEWGSWARLNRVLTFLETCPLNQTSNYPFWFYDATTGGDYNQISDKMTGLIDGVDIGRLFVALNNLKIYNDSLTTRIDNIVLNGRSDYNALLPSIEENASSNNIYSYYFISGYADFFPQVAYVPDQVLANIANSPNIVTYGVSLPKATINLEPMLCAIFELPNVNNILTALTTQVYNAHVAYFNATGKYVAASEGNGFNSQFVYEWVVGPNGNPWEITSPNGQTVTPSPVVFTKVAFGFLALYNSTYARDTAVFLESHLPSPTNGYYEGADNSGNYVRSDSSNTNGLILDAALYATQQ
jgi:hypothetical protein